jgi:electron transfer flavoprotein beta subunit
MHYPPEFSIPGELVKIVVCIKQVPERDARLRVTADGSSIDETGVSTEINESDQYALEAGLRLAEGQSGEVVVECLGPDKAEEAIRRALAMGAARAMHLNDPAFQGGDATATARALAKAIEPEVPDLILTGLQSDDAGWAQTGLLIAERLGLPSATLIMEIEPPANGRIKVKRELESGWFQWITLPLPAVLTIQSGIYPVRYATLKGIMGAKKKEMKKLTPADLGLSPDQIGAAGSGVELLKVYAPEKAKSAQILQGDPSQAAATLVEKLRTEAKVL